MTQGLKFDWIGFDADEGHMGGRCCLVSWCANEVIMCHDVNKNSSFCYCNCASEYRGFNYFSAYVAVQFSCVERINQAKKLPKFV